MKIVHVSTYDSGGAANAMIGLHKELLHLDINSSVLSSIKTRNDIPNLQICERTIAKAAFLQKMLNRFGLPQTTEQKDWWVIKKLIIKDFFRFGKNTGSRLFFSPNSPYRLENHPLVNEADIIHLHWVSGFVNYPTFFKEIKKPIVWTLHDKGVVLGGFHLLLDYINSSKAWQRQSDYYQQKKSEYIQSHHNISIAAPSRVLLDYSRSSYFSKSRHYHIYYGVDTKVFYVQNLARQKKTLFLIVGDLQHYHKGFDILLEALEFIKRVDFEIAVIGNVEPKTLKHYPQLKLIGRINDKATLASFYNQADAVLIPSREDNLPNVMLESLACGTPIIATPVGGMLDVIEAGINGILSKDLTSRSFSEAMLFFLEFKNNFDREKIGSKATSLFSPQKQAYSYLRVYDEVLSKY